MFLALLSPAAAERWTIQVFAYAAAPRAEAVAGGLRGFGYDAYTDALPEGTLTQVRIGCFGSVADANGLAQDVRQRVTLDAFVAPFREGAAATVCAAREPGFIVPASWGIGSRSADGVTFWLEAAGQREITFDGDRWTLLQDAPGGGTRAAPSWLDDPALPPPPPAPPAGLAARFRATRSRGLPLVRADLGGGSLLVSAGELLWAGARAAVVRQGADIFALRLYRP